MVAQRKSVPMDSNAYGDPKSPELGIYTLTFDRIDDFDYGKPFKDEAPKLQFTLIFTLHAPEDEECDGMELKGWYPPKFRQLEGKPTPKLYALLCALNGGTYQQPEGQYDGWDELERFCGTQFRCLVGPHSTSGWARLQGDPMPMPQPKKAKGKLQVVAVTTPEEEGEEEEFDGRF